VGVARRGGIGMLPCLCILFTTLLNVYLILPYLPLLPRCFAAGVAAGPAVGRMGCAFLCKTSAVCLFLVPYLLWSPPLPGGRATLWRQRSSARDWARSGGRGVRTLFALSRNAWRTAPSTALLTCWPAKAGGDACRCWAHLLFTLRYYLPSITNSAYMRFRRKVDISIRICMVCLVRPVPGMVRGCLSRAWTLHMLSSTLRCCCAAALRAK